MYVCVCNSVTDREIRGAVAMGASSLEDLRDSLGVASCCGKCADCSRSVLAKALESVGAPAGDD